MNEIVIEPAQSENLIAISDLTREFFSYMTMNPDKVYERMNQGIHYLVAKENGKTIGFIDYEIINDPAETHPGAQNQKTAKILGLCVAGTHQGQGIGRKLVECTLAEVEGKVAQILLFVEEGNERAIRMYEGYGFTKKGKLQHPIWGKDVFLYTKKI